MICVESRAKSYEMCTVRCKCICICEMLFLACSDHISIISPVSDNQDYDYLYQNKGIDQVRNSRDMMGVYN